MTDLHKNTITKTERFIRSIPELKGQAIRLERFGIDNLDSIQDLMNSMQDEYESIREDIVKIIKMSKPEAHSKNIQNLKMNTKWNQMSKEASLL
ncbi:hypothetical protein PGT21_025462 [Puccinia graminis f. sp. tritici]|uniref:Uncharacterized protein n=1 Tax=Puccinia graminis f. sp. tritici TaxID=56615 RepID=A0A5B0QPJ4_PUCGR|nr:hypothetical protein PGT21_025462 [Puccinia graminis f. sp. tritici]